MRMKGLEPSLLAKLEPKSSASTNSATSACKHDYSMGWFQESRGVGNREQGSREQGSGEVGGIVVGLGDAAGARWGCKGYTFENHPGDRR